MTIGIHGQAEVMLTVIDVAASVRFYRDVLGMQVVHHSEPFTDAEDDYGWAMLRARDAQLMLNNMHENNVRPPLPDAARLAAHRDTCLYFSCPDLDGAYKQLLTQGIAAREPFVTYYGMRQLYFHDPDGYSLCLQHPA